MKKINILFFTAIAILLTLGGCENDGFYYQDSARVRLEPFSTWALGVDTMNYNFVFGGIDATEYDMQITLVLMGEPTDYDRVAKLAVVKEKTTAKDDQYQLPTTVTLPANTYKVTFPVTLKRTADLESKAVTMRFGVVVSDDFEPGINEGRSLVITWNDVIGQPSYWDSELLNFFGAYSDVKYRFIIDIIGTGDLEGLSWAEKYNMNIKLFTALQEYNATNGALMDETNNPVSFPR